MRPQPAQRGGRTKSRATRPHVISACRTIRLLSLAVSRRTSRSVTELFDNRLRAMRRDRAARNGPEIFLLERAFADCIDRLGHIQRTFARALLIGCPDPAWPRLLHPKGDRVEVADPGPLIA